MATVLSTKIILRNDTAASWLEHNPILLPGEFGIEWDTGLFKIGNGTSKYNDLPYAGAPNASGSAILDADGYTLSANAERKLGLNGWGKQYYKWIEDAEGGHHELVPVDANNPWKPNLEPKVAQNTDGVLELAWFEPAPISADEIAGAVSGLENTVKTLEATIGTKEDSATTDSVYGAIASIEERLKSASLPLAGGTMTGELILMDGSPAISEAKVEEKIAQMGTLKRKIVLILPDPAEADEHTIYMIKKGTSLLGNSYDEYFLVEGAFELIGNTAVDIDGYVKKPDTFTEGNIAILTADGHINDAAISAKDIKEHIADDVLHITAEERARWNAGTGESPVYIFGGGLHVDDAGTVNIKVAEESNGLTVTDTGVSLNLATESTAGAMSAEQFNKLANTKEFSGIMLGDVVEATFDSKNRAHIPMANSVSPGLVVSSDEANAVAVDMMSGKMTVNTIETSKLVVPEGQELVLNGGSATVTQK